MSQRYLKSAIYPSQCNVEKKTEMDCILRPVPAFGWAPVMSGGSSSDKEHVETEKTASFKNSLASVRKTKAESSDSSIERNEDELEHVNGFQLIDITILAAVFEPLLCPLCKQGHVFDKDKEPKMGFASLSLFKCTTQKCSFYR